MERRGNGDNLGFEQFVPSVEEKTTIAEAAGEVVEKLPEQKMEETKQKMDQTGMAVMHAGMRMRHMFGRRMPPMG
ncbi:MAG: hypothetical protein ACOZAR_00430 [Patescibacteria group bacterium]